MPFTIWVGSNINVDLKTRYFSIISLAKRQKKGFCQIFQLRIQLNKIQNYVNSECWPLFPRNSKTEESRMHQSRENMNCCLLYQLYFNRLPIVKVRTVPKIVLLLYLFFPLSVRLWAQKWTDDGEFWLIFLADPVFRDLSWYEFKI